MIALAVAFLAVLTMGCGEKRASLLQSSPSAEREFELAKQDLLRRRRFHATGDLTAPARLGDALGGRFEIDYEAPSSSRTIRFQGSTEVSRTIVIGSMTYGSVDRGATWVGADLTGGGPAAPNVFDLFRSVCNVRGSAGKLTVETEPPTGSCKEPITMHLDLQEGRVYRAVIVNATDVGDVKTELKFDFDRPVEPIERPARVDE